jgi:L-lactate dehydrogenase complex protein LldF
MEVRSHDFVSLAEIAIRDKDTQAAVTKGTNNAYNNRLNAMFMHGDEHGEAMRQQAAEAKRRALRNLPDLLGRAESNMQSNGIQVLWAADADEANKLMLEIAERHGVESVAKSKSMVTEEIGLNHALENAGLEVVETDLGEWILQLNDETPSHIIAPVIHKTKEQVREIFIREMQMPDTDDTVKMVTFARETLRQKFEGADMGVTGGNFIIAETGSLALVMNEGNGRMVTALPDLHVAVVGIEKVIESVEDYVTLTQVLPRSGTGQKMPVYTNLISGPSQDGDGPKDVYVILLDNGRSEIYGTKYAEALACIRCGACLNACPVYRSTGGHAYGWVYGGPIGAVLTPLYIGLDRATPLPQASTLCGSCKQVCPVDIDLPRMLLDLRADIVEQQEAPARWNNTMKLWALGNKSPRLYAFGGKAAKLGIRLGLHTKVPNPLKTWQEHRDFPGFAPKSFHELWKERQNGQS